MNFILFEMEGKEAGRGTLPKDIELANHVPTHGSISIEIQPHVWLNFLTSEWLSIDISEPGPVNWEDA